MALTFKVQCEEFAQKLQINLNTVIRRCAAQLYSDIVTRWPVDTGYSRRNWQVSADPPPSDVIGLPPKKVHGKAVGQLEPLYAPAGPATQIPDMPKDAMRIWIVNNVEYAEALENGWSKQAPQGAVRIAIAQLEGEMNAIMGGLQP
jgi:hypothetical protein